MAFIRRPRRLGAGWALCLLTFLLAGCATWSESDKKPLLDPDDPAWQPTPNPYLQQSVKISDSVRQSFEAAVKAMDEQRWSQAQVQLEALTANHSELSGPWVNLGIVLRHQNQLIKAEAAFEQAIAVNPLNNDAYIQYAVLLREQGRFDEAEALYLQALKVWPHSPKAHRNLGILYDLYMGQWPKAMEHYQMALKVSEEPSRELEGWIIDLRRRMEAS